VSLRDAACAPIAFGTTQHMLFDNAKLKPGETILVHAAGSGIGSVAIKMAKAIGCTVITTVGDDAKAEKAKALGADHIINYKTDRFEGAVRKLTAKKGVDVVFEHVGAEDLQRLAPVPQARRSAGHLRLDLGALDHHQPDAAVPAAVSHHQLVRRFDAKHSREPRQDGERLLPVIDTEVALADFERGLERLESRQVFGKIIVTF
jgi:alcohol dehydrogenase